jgi:hypothetical protein
MKKNSLLPVVLGAALIAAAPARGQGVSAQNVAFFTATFAGTGTAYTAQAPGFSLAAGHGVCGMITTTSGAAPTLRVNQGAPKPMVFNTGVGQLPVGLGDIRAPMTNCWLYDGANFVNQGPLVSGPPIKVSDAVDVGKWSSCQSYMFSTAGQVLTIAAVAGLPGSGCVTITTIGVTATLTATNPDAINGGAPGGSITIPADTALMPITTTAANVINAPLPALAVLPLTWSGGSDLSTTPLPVGGFTRPRTVYNLNCIIAAVEGGAASIDIWAAANTVAPVNAATSGTKLSSVPCNANSLTAGAGGIAFQDLGVVGGAAQVSANSELYAVCTGAGCIGSGRGKLQVLYR